LASASAQTRCDGGEGYGPGHPASADRAVALPEDPPLTAVAVDTGPHIDAVLDEVLGERATVLPGVDGTAGERRQPAQFLRHGAYAPLMVVAVGSGERIGMMLPELGGLFRHPLMTLAKVRLCKRDGQLISRPETLPAQDAAAEPAGMTPRLKLTVYTSQAARRDGRPAHRAIISRLRSAGVSGATSQTVLTSRADPAGK
jgi:PII-like signaling protein